MSETSAPWWRNTWMEAVWASDLKPLEKLVAAVYADHARDQRMIWVTLDRLVQRSGIGRTQAKMWRRRLIESGWLVEFEPARQHKAAVYVLVIPEGARGSENRPSEGDPRGSDARPADKPRGSEYDVQGVGIPAPGGRIPDPNQSSIKEQHQSSSSRTPAQKHLAHLLGWDEEDERLDLVDAFLNARNVGKANAWMNACHRDGSLERHFLAFVEEQKADQPFVGSDDEDIWGRKPSIDSMIIELGKYFEYPGDRDEALLYEARAMGLPEADAFTNRMVLSSALNTAHHNAAKEAS